MITVNLRNIFISTHGYSKQAYWILGQHVLPQDPHFLRILKSLAVPVLIGAQGAIEGL